MGRKENPLPTMRRIVATVVVPISLHQKESRMNENQEKSETLGRVIPTNSLGFDILLVDDDPVFCEVMVRHARRYAVHLATCQRTSDIYKTVLCEDQEKRGTRNDIEGARRALAGIALCLSETLLALQDQAAAASASSLPLSVAG
jgi:hypothetical protein